MERLALYTCIYLTSSAEKLTLQAKCIVLAKHNVQLISTSPECEGQVFYTPGAQPPSTATTEGTMRRDTTVRGRGVSEEKDVLPLMAKLLDYMPNMSQVKDPGR